MLHGAMRNDRGIIPGREGRDCNSLGRFRVVVNNFESIELLRYHNVML